VTPLLLGYSVTSSRKEMLKLPLRLVVPFARPLAKSRPELLLKR
jgi:hypothetical protein